MNPEPRRGGATGRRRESRLGISFQSEVIEALGQTGCGFCRLGLRSVTRYLDILGYENVNDVPVRETIREALGLCNRHAWQFLQETREVLGVAIIARDLLRTLQQRTPERGEEADLASRLQGLTRRGRCVACVDLATSTDDCVDLLLKGWNETRLRDAFAASEGLCWTHLVVTLAAARSSEQRSQIAAAQRADWRRREDHAREHPELLREALASAPRIWGTEIDALPGVGPEGAPAPPPRAAEGHCPICRVVRAWLDESDSRPLPSHEGLLCAVHAWQPLGEALIGPEELERRLEQLGRRLDAVAEAGPAEPAILRWTRRYRRPTPLPAELTAGLDCPVCKVQRELELSLMSHLEPATLCMPHLRLAAARHPAFPEIRVQTRATWHHVELLLAEFIRKHDYRFHHEPLTDLEGRSPAWATELLAGVEGIR